VLEESIKTVVEGCGVQLYDVVTLKENDMNIFRVYITAQGGVSLDKCAEVSRMLSPLLDVDEPLHGKYNLEVSSPGIERKLTKPSHFEASIGENIVIKDREKESIKGKLLAVLAEESIEIETKHGKEIIAFDQISTVKTYFDWN
jgi:ribosome maturation factor RimP